MREPEHRARVSKRAKRWAQKHPDHAPNLGRKFDKEWRANIAIAHQGYVMPEEQKRKIGASCKGKTLGRKQPKSAVEKMRKTLLAKGDQASSKRPEVRAKLSKAHGGHNKKQTIPEAILHDSLDKRSWKYIGSGFLSNGEPNKHYDARLRVPVGADFVCFATRTLIFLDGCYWHECPQHGSGRFPHKPKKDNELRSQAQKQGWNIVRIWEHEVRTDVRRLRNHLKTGG